MAFAADFGRSIGYQWGHAELVLRASLARPSTPLSPSLESSSGDRIVTSGAPLDLASRIAPIRYLEDDAEYRFERLGPANEEGVDRLYHEVFPEIRDRESFRWKFHRAPEGPALAHVAVHRESGEVVASCAGRLRRFWIDGREVTAAQTFEAATHPGHRRLRLFRAVMAGFAMQVTEAGALFAFGGKMGEAAFRVGQRVFGFFPYLELRTWEVRLSYRVAFRRRAGAPGLPLAWAADGLKSLFTPAQRGSLRFERARQCGVEFDQLWQRTRDSLRVSAVRDSRWLNYRFRDCPVGEHRIWQAFRGEALVGYLVLRLWEQDGVRMATVLDWLDGQDPGLLREMLVHAVEDARSCGCDFLQLAAAEGSHAEAAVSGLPGFAVTEREALDRVAGNLMPFGDPEDPAFAFLGAVLDPGAWHYAQGDSDFHD